MYIEPMILNITVTGTESSESFTLRYGSMESIELTAKNSASQFDSAITDIVDGTTGSSIRVFKSVSNEEYTFQVIFFEAVSRSTTLEVGRYNSSLINVVITTIQMGRLPDDLILSLPTRSTSAISLPSERTIIEDHLHSIISASCTTTASGEIFWTHSYDNTPGPIWGTLDNTVDPMCGRYSLKNPIHVFIAFHSRDEITGERVGNIPWEIYNWVCFLNCGHMYV